MIAISPFFLKIFASPQCKLLRPEVSYTAKAQPGSTGFAHTRNEQWLPYFNVLLKYDCDALWMWSENELKEVQDENLAKRAIEWKELISTVADKIIPKLNNFGLFTGNDLDSETLVSIFFRGHFLLWRLYPKLN